jgi:hypothetical protein
MYDKHGLSNLGNTCFINATIQCLNNLKPFRDFLLKNASSFNSGLVGSFIKVLQYLNNQKSKSYYLNDFIKSFYSSNSIFKKGEQNDSYIFLVSLLNTMDKELRTYYRNDCIKKLFSNEIENRIVDNYSSRIDEDSEPSFCLSLPIQNKKGRVYSSIEECLEEFQKTKEIVDSYTGKVYREHIKIKQSGTFLIINLQRISNGRHIKNAIKFEEYLQFNDTLYELTGFVKHIGDEFYGHKIAICKDYTSWFEFDDSSVGKLSSSLPNVGLVFLLFYQKMENNSNLQTKSQIITNNIPSSKELRINDYYKVYETEQKEKENKENYFLNQLYKSKLFKHEIDFLALNPSKVISKYDFQTIYKINNIPDKFLENNDINYFKLIYFYKKFLEDNSIEFNSKNKKKK